MKMIFPLVMALMISSCGGPPSESDYNAAKFRMEEAGRNIGSIEHSLSEQTKPGEIALLTEDLRDAKLEMEKAADSIKDVMPRDEALKIVEMHRKSMVASALKSSEEMKKFIKDLDDD